MATSILARCGQRLGNVTKRPLRVRISKYIVVVLALSRLPPETLPLRLISRMALTQHSLPYIPAVPYLPIQQPLQQVPILRAPQLRNARCLRMDVGDIRRFRNALRRRLRLYRHSIRSVYPSCTGLLRNASHWRFFN